MTKTVLNLNDSYQSSSFSLKSETNKLDKVYYPLGIASSKYPLKCKRFFFIQLVFPSMIYMLTIDFFSCASPDN